MTPLWRLSACVLLLSASAHSLAAPEPRTATEASTIPFKRESRATTDMAWQSGAALALAGLAAYGAILLLKRFNARTVLGNPRTRHVQVVESTRVSRKAVLHVVEYEGQRLLLGDNDGELRVLANSAQSVAGRGDA